MGSLELALKELAIQFQKYAALTFKLPVSLAEKTTQSLSQAKMKEVMFMPWAQMLIKS